MKPIAGYVLSVAADLDLDEIWEYIAADTVVLNWRVLNLLWTHSSWMCVVLAPSISRSTA